MTFSKFSELQQNPRVVGLPKVSAVISGITHLAANILTVLKIQSAFYYYLSVAIYCPNHSERYQFFEQRIIVTELDYQDCIPLGCIPPDHLLYDYCWGGGGGVSDEVNDLSHPGEWEEGGGGGLMLASPLNYTVVPLVCIMPVLVSVQITTNSV